MTVQDHTEAPGHRPESAQHGATRRRLLALGAVLMLGLAAATCVLVINLRRIQQSNLVLQREFAACQSELSETRSNAFARIRQVEDASQRLVEKTAADLLREHSASGEAVLHTSQGLVADLAQREECAREHIVEDLHAAREEIVVLRQQIDKTLAQQVPGEAVFQKIQQANDPSILLLHSEFTYRSRNEDGGFEIQTGCGWGTGFVVSDEGHIITNKHVVQPWKFDPELCAMAAMGEVEIDPGSLKLAAWPAGTRCMDEARNLTLDSGYNNSQLGNLRLFAVAEDHMSKKEMVLGGTTIPYEVHALDDNDVAVLKASGTGFKAVRCLRRDQQGKVHKLDRVMTLGFPRGQNGLERGLAETSPSLGTVRKVEDTIHVTASIIPGNSGGPVFDRDGEVVAIATRIYSETLGICIRVHHAMDLLDKARALELARMKESLADGSAVDMAASPAVLTLTGEK